MMWYGEVCPGIGALVLWYGMAWYGMVWHGMAWYGMAWHGMVWYGKGCSTRSCDVGVVGVVGSEALSSREGGDTDRPLYLLYDYCGTVHSKSAFMRTWHIACALPITMGSIRCCRLKVA